MFDFVRTWKLSQMELAPVISIDISPQQEEFLACSCRNNNIYMTHYKSIGLNEAMDKDVKVD